MATSYTLDWVTTSPGGGVTTSKTLTAEANVEIDLSVATATTDKEVAFTLDVSKCVAFEIVSDQAVTIEFCSSVTGTPTIVLVANLPYRWCTGCVDAFLLTVDVTKFYVTNVSGSTAAIKLRAAYDAQLP